VLDNSKKTNTGNTKSELDFIWTYSFGGNFDILFDVWLIGIGGGMAGPNLVDKGKSLYPFIRGTIGLYMNSKKDAGKLYYDYNLENNGFKAGLLICFYK
jgi:hypothetical protein